MNRIARMFGAAAVATACLYAGPAGGAGADPGSDVMLQIDEVKKGQKGIYIKYRYKCPQHEDARTEHHARFTMKTTSDEGETVIQKASNNRSLLCDVENRHTVTAGPAMIVDDEGNFKSIAETPTHGPSFVQAELIRITYEREYISSDTFYIKPVPETLETDAAFFDW